MMPLDNAKRGAYGEKLAVKWLRSNGFMICDLNWRSGRYEIDIVAERWGTIHIIEVKSRSLSGYTTPEEAITTSKRESLIKAARAYVATHALREEIQFDLVAVEFGGDDSVAIRHIEHIVEFEW